MSDIAIVAHNLSKLYRIGQAEERPDTFFGAMASWLRSPATNYRRLRSLSRFDDTDADDIIWALRDVSFEIKQGEVVGVIGRNGAGKSTLLKILSRITEPTSGYAVVNGRVASLLEVGTGFHDELTGRENVYLNGTILGMKKAEVDRKFDEIVDFSGVEKFIDTPVKRYSSGMRVRLAFAVAAHLEPEVLLIDEVLAVGDLAFQNRCLGKMEEVAQGGRTVLFVSHHMGMIRSLCSTGILLARGCIKNIGNVNNIVDQYLKATEVGNISGLAKFTDEAHKDWDRETISLTEIRLVQNGSILLNGVVEADKPLDVEFVYVLKKDVAPFRIKLRVYTQEGVEVFFTDDTVSNREREFRSQGSYITRCQIPENFFNTKRYRMVIGIDSPGFKHIIPFTSALAFDVVNTSDESRFRKTSGTVDPKFVWEDETEIVPAELL